MKKIAITLYCLCLGLLVNGQQILDVIYLKDGNVLKGTILSYQQKESVRLKLLDGETRTISDSDIQKITQERMTEEVKEPVVEAEPQRKIPYSFKEKGIYNITFLSMANGKLENEFQFGIGVHNVTGYQFSRLLGIGVGVGIDNFSLGSGEVIYPIYAEARGYFKRKNKSPYYALAAGYGFAFKNENQFVTKANGGAMFHPAFGYRFGGTGQGSITIDIGLKLQQASFEKMIVFTGEIETREVLYKRIAVRAGLLF